ncbi:hypothetical protein M0804_002961 [Polistes exclamans]|nr:hypothetical protein M0804_002961 [Polistes exclamans]
MLEMEKAAEGKGEDKTTFGMINLENPGGVIVVVVDSNSNSSCSSSDGGGGGGRLTIRTIAPEFLKPTAQFPRKLLPPPSFY